MLKKLFLSFGTALTLSRGSESWEIRGFLQPDTSKARQNMYPELSAVGFAAPGQYLFLGPAEPEAQVGDTLTLGGKAYLLRRRETMYEKDQPLYQWGLCTEKGGTDTWPILS